MATRKRTDRVKALDAINTLWNNYDEKCDGIWRDGVSLMAHMLEFFPRGTFEFDPKKCTWHCFLKAKLNVFDRDPVVEVETNDGIPVDHVWVDFADVDVETQRNAIAEVGEALFKGVEL